MTVTTIIGHSLLAQKVFDGLGRALLKVEYVTLLKVM